MNSLQKPQYEIYALKYAGPFTSSGAFLLWLKDWEKTLNRYYYIWCIKAGREPIIVDCGVPPRLANQKNLGAGYVNPVDVLSKIGVNASEVTKVIITHIHWDHSSGIELFPNATFYLQEKEFNFWIKDPIAKRPPFAHVSDDISNAYLTKLETSDRLILINGDQEIMPGIELLYAPGHTPGLQAVAVNTKQGIAILGSDCAHIFRSYREDWPSCLIVDLVAWMKSYDKLRKKASSIDLIFPGHDPLMLTNYPKVAEDITRLV